MIISIYTQNTQPTTQEEEKPMVILTTDLAQNTIDLSQEEADLLDSFMQDEDDCELETEIIEIEIRNLHGMPVSLTNKQKEKLAMKLHKTIFKFLAKKGL
jgi:hypothetical protein